MNAENRKRVLVVEDDRTTRLLLNQTLSSAGFEVVEAEGAAQALEQCRDGSFDLMLLDIWLPGKNGLDLLAELNEQTDAKAATPRVVVMTSDDTSETMLRALKQRTFHYVTKPIEPKQLIEIIRAALDSPEIPPIQVVSARPNWVELIVPCDLAAAQRIQSFLVQLDTDLSDDLRDSVGTVFRELLLNAIEWGGKLDPTREVRIAYLRAERMLVYRIADPGEGFRFEELDHAAVGNPPDDPGSHMMVREEKGMRSGGFGLLIARELVDELIYNEKHNEVVFVKYLD